MLRSLKIAGHEKGMHIVLLQVLTFIDSVIDYGISYNDIHKVHSSYLRVFNWLITFSQYRLLDDWAQ